MKRTNHIEKKKKKRAEGSKRIADGAARQLG
jgi:hypothetical protein